MKTRFITFLRRICLAWAIGSLLFPLRAEPPSIIGIQLDSDDLVVRVQVPPGLRRVTLESRERLATGAWVPRAVERLSGTGGIVNFRLARSAMLEMLRVRGDEREALPASFFTGRTNFTGAKQTTQPIPSQTGGPTAVNADTSTPGAGSENRQVVESDIWAIRGTTVYFFNQYRGLQILDISSPTAPTIRGELSLPAVGEQLYVLDDGPVVLLARNGCGWFADGGSQVVVVDPGLSPPRIIATCPVNGTITESRLVGRALYIAAQTYRKVTVVSDPKNPVGSEQWEAGLEVCSLDLADPGHPVARTTLWYPGYGNALAATDRFLFVVAQDATNWWQSAVRIIDIDRPDGTMTALATIRPAGRVADKFKLNLNPRAALGDVLTVISEEAGNGSTRRSVLETYALANPANPQPLGRLEVGHGEGLYATRFDGDRAYLVTFLRIDPLWIVDLSDPVHPRLSGELQVPGWSTYLHPLGDRLVTIGIDNTNSWRVAVSLFDVQDPTRPALLAKVPLGDGYSWSEATWDEKAFTVLPGAGMVLVPYQGWSSNGYASRIQIIDLGRDTLTRRGVIDHEMQPRRATAINNQLVSISGRELFVVSALDRDHPNIVASLALSWSVNRVLLAGDHLLEVTDGTTWNADTHPVVRVTARNRPQEALTEMRLASPWPILGATVRNDHAFVLQGARDVSSPGTNASGLPAPNLRLSVVDLTQLPALTVVGQAEAYVPVAGWLPGFRALWLPSDHLVWAAESSGLIWLDAPGAMMTDFRWWPGWGSGGGRFLAFDCRNPEQIAFDSDLDLFQTELAWGTSQPYLAGNLVYLSHDQTHFVPDESTGGTKDGSIPPAGHWETRHFLDVIDYTDPKNPTVRKPVNLPGQLAGLALGGNLLYTEGSHYDDAGTTDWTSYLDALAYDGVTAALIRSMRLSTNWPRAELGYRDGMLLAQSDADRHTGSVQWWELATAGPEAGNFVRRGSLSLPGPANGLDAVGDLVVASRYPGTDLLDWAWPDAPRLLKSVVNDACSWWDLAHADGALGAGLWIPLQDFGVREIPLAP